MERKILPRRPCSLDNAGPEPKIVKCCELLCTTTPSVQWSDGALMSPWIAMARMPGVETLLPRCMPLACRVQFNSDGQSPAAHWEAAAGVCLQVLQRLSIKLNEHRTSLSTVPLLAHAYLSLLVRLTLCLPLAPSLLTAFLFPLIA